jgi:hypothetical protein
MKNFMKFAAGAGLLAAALYLLLAMPGAVSDNVATERASIAREAVR